MGTQGQGGARGEQILQLEGREVRILLTNRALAAIENSTGMSIGEIGNNLKDGKLSVTVTATMLRFGMEEARKEARAGGRAVTQDDAYEALDEIGITEATNAVMLAFADVVSYSRSKNA